MSGRTLNLIQLIGWATGDAAMRHIPGGGLVTNFSLAVEASRADGATQFLKVSAHGQLAELAADMVKKGSSVYVAGPLETRSFKGSDGRVRSVTEVIAKKFIVLGGRGDASGESAQGTAAAVLAEEPGQGLDLSPYI